LLAKLRKEESGYSLVEVIASIMILSIAILPMVGMFDMGLEAASTSSNYDEARTLANTNLEAAKGMSRGEAAGLSTCPTEGEPAFVCEIEGTYVHLSTTGAGTATFEDSGVGDPRTMVKVTVTVGWGDGSEYSTAGVVAR